MVTYKLEGINKVKKKLADRTTKIYYYHRASGKRLSGEPGSAEFHQSFMEAERISPRDTGTVAGLIREYHSNNRAVVLADRYAAEANAAGDAAAFMRWSRAAERIAEIVQAQMKSARLG